MAERDDAATPAAEKATSASTPGEDPSVMVPESGADEVVDEDDGTPSGAPESDAPSPTEPPATLPFWVGPLCSVVLVAVGVGVGLQPSFAGSPATWWIVLLPYAVLGTLASWYLARRDALLTMLRPRYGDATIGIVLGLALTAVGIVGQSVLAPSGSNGAAWLFRIYLHAGDVQTDGTLIALLFVIVLLEELVWRGMVLDQLAGWAPRAAPALCAVAYALATSPTVFLLSDPAAGANPLVILAALGSGLIWCYARVILNRITPVVISHLVFSYFMAAPLPEWLRLV